MSNLANKTIKLTGASILLFSSLNVYAASFQFFNDLNYENPASLSQVHKFQAKVGDNIFFTSFNFKGMTGPLNGNVTSNQTDNIPYGQIAWRFSPQIVAAVNITEPLFLNIQYPKNSFLRFNSTATILRNVDISPRIAIQPTQKLTLGIGFNANTIYNAQLNFVVPPIAGPYGELKNKFSSWGYGFNAGFSYAVAKGTIIAGSYYSKILQHLAGSSTWGPIDTQGTARLLIPSVWSVDILQFLSQQWLVDATVRYSQWNQSPNSLILQNTAIGLIPIPESTHNTLTAQLGTRYQFNDYLAIVAGAAYDSGNQGIQYRSVTLPNYQIWAVGVGSELTFKKDWVIKGVYSYGWSNPPINTSGIIGPLVGNEYTHANSLDVSLTYKV